MIALLKGLISFGVKVLPILSEAWSSFKSWYEKREMEKKVREEDERQKKYRLADELAQKGETCELEKQFDRSKSCDTDK